MRSYHALRVMAKKSVLILPALFDDKASVGTQTVRAVKFISLASPEWHTATPPAVHSLVRSIFS